MAAVTTVLGVVSIDPGRESATPRASWVSVFRRGPPKIGARNFAATWRKKTQEPQDLADRPALKGVEFISSGRHGVGLCQWGSRLQTEKGRKCRTSSYYFPAPCSPSFLTSKGSLT